MGEDVSDIGLGCVTFGREIDETTSRQLLDHAFERGIRLFDTAAAYGGGASETIVGGWVASRRLESGSVTVATKFLPPYTPERVSAVVDESLSRLGMASLDLLYLHKWDGTAERVEFAAALDRVVRDGRVRALGASNYDREQFGKALEIQDRHGLERFSVLQNNFNFAVSDIDPGFREFCKSRDIAVVAYSPLGAGFLTGKHKNGVELGSRFDLVPGHGEVYFNKEAENRLSRLESVAERSRHPQAHLALSWAMHQPGIDTVLVGARTTAHIDQALAAKDFRDPKVFGELGI
ncbi:MAG: aldo/keto reductase [Verrucomicrobiales bacterium]